jgi:zinc transport system ATP-binding protein
MSSISKRRLIPVVLMVFSCWLGEWSFIASAIRSILDYSRSGLIAYPTPILPTDELVYGIYWKVDFFRGIPNLEIIVQSGFNFAFLAFWVWFFYEFVKSRPIALLPDFVLKVSKLSVKVHNEVILDNVSFVLKRGESLAIAGPNGGGKSTLFRALLNLVPYTGQIEWAGRPKLGYVPQKLSARDIPISVREFLSMKNVSNMNRSLKAVGLDSGILDKTMGALSGGQLQRVLIAWAIIDIPSVLLLDEPTASVDLNSKESINRMLNELKQQYGITILLITHDLHVVSEYSDYLLGLNKRMIYFGESKNIMDSDVQNTIFRNGLHHGLHYEME